MFRSRVAVLAVVVLTLYPDGAPYPTVTCDPGLPYLAPTAVESTADILLFVPVSFLAGVLWRRPVVAVIGAVVLAATALAWHRRRTRRRSESPTRDTP